MAQHQRRNAPAAVAQKPRHVRPTNPSCGNRNFAVARSRPRPRTLFQPHLMRCGINQCAHCFSSSLFSQNRAAGDAASVVIMMLELA
jgi:hypothetical protein